MADEFQEIHMPNGDVLQFPRDMPDEHIKAAIQKSIAPFSAPGYQIPPKAPPLGEALRDISMTAVKGIPVAGPLAAEPGHALISAAMGGGEGQDFNERYKDQLAKYTEQLKGFESAHPMETTVLGGAGGAAATGPMMMAAPAMFGATGLGTGANMVMGGVGGAGIGAADAYMRGGNPLAGGAIGGVLGGAAPGVARGAGALAQGAYDAFNPTAGNALLKGIDSRALDFAKRAAKADGLTPAQIDAKFQELGPHGFLAEYGPNLRGLAGATAAMPGQGKKEIFDAFTQRGEGSRDRIESAITQTLGPRTDLADLTRRGIADRKAAADPLYKAWRETTVQPTQEINDLLPVLQKAGLVDEGHRLMQLEAAAGGQPAPQGFPPTTQSYDYIKQAIDDRIKGSLQNGAPTNETRIYTMLKKRLDEVVSNANPDAAAVWKQAREAWANPTAIMNARESGQSLWAKNTRRDELSQELRDMSLPERLAFRQGARDSLAEMMDNSTRGDTNARNLLMSPAAQDKLTLLSSRNQALSPQDLVGRMQQEATFAGNQSRTVANSETAARQAMGEMLKPNPEDTLVSRLRHMYSPHVTPGVLLPKVFEKAAAGRQEAQYEAARDALAPLLTQQGTSARDLAKALTEAGNRRNIKTPVSTYANLLLQGGLVPQSRQQLTPPQ